MFALRVLHLLCMPVREVMTSWIIPVHQLSSRAHDIRYTEVPPERLETILHHLNTVFLADKSERELLRLPVNKLVDFRASCFCHSRAIDEFGFVCSECFSGEPRHCFAWGFATLCVCLCAQEECVFRVYACMHVFNVCWHVCARVMCDVSV